MTRRTALTLLCPVCAETLDIFNVVNKDRPPGPGDLLLCSSCLSILQLEPDNYVSIRARSDMSIPMLHELRRLERTVQELYS